MAGIDINLSKELLPWLLSNQDGLAEIRRRLAESRERFSKSAPKAVECLEAGFDDTMAVMVLPDKYRKRLRTANMQEYHEWAAHITDQKCGAVAALSA